MKTRTDIKPEKKDFVASLSERLKSSKSVSFVDYSGMGVKPQQELKNKLSEVGGSMMVAKNTLIRLAAKDAKFPESSVSDDVLSGQTAIVFASDDAVAPIQILGKFIKENDFPKMKAGMVEGGFQDADSMKRISTLPNKETLYAQTVGAISAPMYGIVGVMQANIQKLLYILDTKSKS